MLKILYLQQIQELEPYVKPHILEYIKQEQMGNFETFEEFCLMRFDWYDISANERDTHPLFLYFSRQELFFLCGDSRMLDRVREIVAEEREEEGEDNALLLYRFFARLLKGDRIYLDRFETAVTDAEDEMLSGSGKEYLQKIIEFRKALLGLKSYYEQLAAIFDEMEANDNGLLGPDDTRRFHILGKRLERYLNEAGSLREYVSQMREAYQSKIDIQQNELMRLFTVITTIFLPLTLLVGWYGMNFNIPEFSWAYGYAAVIAASILIVVGLMLYFKKKKWL